MWRPVLCLFLLIGFGIALTPADAKPAMPPADAVTTAHVIVVPESISTKSESGGLGLDLNWRQHAHQTCPDGNCPGGQCYRHDAPQKVELEVKQSPTPELHERHPLAVPLLVLAIVFVVGGGMYYAGWFTH